MKSYAYIRRVKEKKRFSKNDSSSFIIIKVYFKAILRIKLIIEAIEKTQQINILLVCFRGCDECTQLVR